jgi:hypothetical protein
MTDAVESGESARGWLILSFEFPFDWVCASGYTLRRAF